MCTCHTVVSGSTSVSRLLMFHSHLLCSLSLQNILYQKSFPDEMIDRFMATMGSRYRAGYCLAGSDLDERIPRGFLNHAHLPQSLEAATTRRIQPSKPSPTNLARFSTHDHCIKSLDLTWSPRCSLPLQIYCRSYTMVYLKSSFVFLLSVASIALATPVKRTVDQVKADIADISAKVTSLDSAITAFPLTGGSLVAALVSR